MMVFELSYWVDFCWVMIVGLWEVGIAIQGGNYQYIQRSVYFLIGIEVLDFNIQLLVI